MSPTCISYWTFPIETTFFAKAEICKGTPGAAKLQLGHGLLADKKVEKTRKIGALARGRSEVSIPVSNYIKSLDFYVWESESNLGFYGDLGNRSFSEKKCGMGIFCIISHEFLRFLDWAGPQSVLFQTRY
jgi:hypothetical protein